MNPAHSDKVLQHMERLQAFMDAEIDPREQEVHMSQRARMTIHQILRGD